jgi:hypothetical protein
MRCLMPKADARKKGKGPDVGRKPPRLAAGKLDRLIEEALVDAYGEEEQQMGFCTMLEDHLAMPFETEVLGVEVTVQRVDLTDDGQIVAVCARGRLRQAIPILALPLPDPPPPGAEWIQAYRRWARGVTGGTTGE